MASIVLISHDPLDGAGTRQFRFLWGKRVTGFYPHLHCARSLIGSYTLEVNRDMGSGDRTIDLGDADFFYLCGVTKKWDTNLHLAVRPRLGARCSITAYNGVRFQILGGDAIAIPMLPDGWRGLPTEFTRCRNFQFGVDRYGYTR